MPVYRSVGRKYYPVDWAYKTRVAVLGATREKGFNYNLRHFILEPGGVIPLHVHSNVYHLQYMLKGEIRLRVGEEEYLVRPGDVMYLPSRIPHRYENAGQDEAEFLCITPLIPDRMEILEKIGGSGLEASKYEDGSNNC